MSLVIDLPNPGREEDPPPAISGPPLLAYSVAHNTGDFPIRVTIHRGYGRYGRPEPSNCIEIPPGQHVPIPAALHLVSVEAVKRPPLPRKGLMRFSR